MPLISYTTACLKFCPACGDNTPTSADHHFVCGACGLVLHTNPATSVAGIIEYDDQILVVVRGQEPAKGKLDLPGGFIDPDENAVQALERELLEELGYRGFQSRYFGTYPNTYSYRGIDYKTLDIVFVIKANHLPEPVVSEEITSVQWVKKSACEIEKFGFDSVRRALSDYLSA